METRLWPSILSETPWWKAWDVPVVEVHVAFPFVEGLGRPQVAMLKVLKLEAHAFLKLEGPVLAFHFVRNGRPQTGLQYSHPIIA